MKDVFSDDTRVFAQIIRKVHIVDDLKINMFIETNIFISKRMIIDFVIQFIKINNCRNMIIFMNSRARFELIKKTIKLSTRIILLSHVTTSIAIIYFDKLLKDRDLFFESQCSLSLRYVKKIYVYMMNVFFREI